MNIENKNLENQNQEHHSSINELQQIIAKLTQELENKNFNIVQLTENLKNRTSSLEIITQSAIKIEAKLTQELKNKNYELESAHLKIEELEKNLRLSRNQFSKLKKLFAEVSKVTNDKTDDSYETKIEKIENITELPVKKPSKFSSVSPSLDQKCSHIKDELDSIQCDCCKKLRKNIVETFVELQTEVLYFHDRMVEAEYKAEDLNAKNGELSEKYEELVSQMYIVIADLAKKDEKIAAIRDFYEGQLAKWERFKYDPRADTPAGKKSFDRIFAYDKFLEQLKFAKRDCEFFKKQFKNFMKNYNFTSQGYGYKFLDLFGSIELMNARVLDGFVRFMDDVG